MARELTEDQIAKARAAKERPAAPVSREAMEPIETLEEMLADEEAAEAEPDPAVERRKRLLGDLDAETAALFSDEDLAKIEADERAKALAEKKKQALADVRSTARHLALVDNDLIPASTLRSEEERRRLAEPVTFRVMLPGDGAGHHGRNGFRVDGFLYQVGRTYTRSRAVFESLQANHYRAWLNEVRFKTLDQHKAGQTAEEVLAQTIPRFEVVNAA